MQLGKALLGAIIGAALGIGLLLAVYLLFDIDNVWLAIPFALITGLGVRMVAVHDGPRELRPWRDHDGDRFGRLYWRLGSRLQGCHREGQCTDAETARVGPGSAGRGRATDEADAEPPVETPAVEQPKAAAPRVDIPRPRADAPRAFSTWDFIWL